MNWLGKIVQKHISRNDTVLDLGCGIMQATTNIPQLISGKKNFIKKDSDQTIICKSILGCDSWDNYLNVTKKFYPVIRLRMDELIKFVNDSFDVVICLDVLEHLEFKDACIALDHMKRIARRKVLVYTPSKSITNEEHMENAWGLGENPNQAHVSFIAPNLLEEFGFTVSFPEPDKNTLGIFAK